MLAYNARDGCHEKICLFSRDQSVTPNIIINSLVLNQVRRLAGQVVVKKFTLSDYLWILAQYEK